MAGLTAGAWASQLSGRFGSPAWAQTSGTVLHPAGTTFERAVVTTGGGPYFRLGFGPGWPLVVREELATPRSGREDRRRPLVGFLHLTDFQLADVQSPARVEFLDRYTDIPPLDVFSAAYRPQEPLIVHVVEALVRQYRAVARGPVTGVPVSFSICTGDNLDNTQANEMRWFATLMNGGELAANSGDASTWEGVHAFADPTTYDDHYWHPEELGGLVTTSDRYKTVLGFPSHPGLLQAVMDPFTAVGLPHRWFTAYGNHDYLAQGNAPVNPSFDAIAMGPLKVLHPPPGLSPSDILEGLTAGDPDIFLQLSLGTATPVTADPERHMLSPGEYIQAHLDLVGPFGPAGHGFTEDNLDRTTLYYTFEVADGVLGIVLDTNSPVLSEGSLDVTQLGWLEQRLIEAHSRYFDAAGTEVMTGNEDQLVVLFSHHRPASLVPFPAGVNPDGTPDERVGADPVLELLHRFPNLVLWVNGHSHFNRVVAHPDPSGRTPGFWDITTSAQIDPPQQARILEIVDNADGTLSIFTTIVDHAGTIAPVAGARELLDLAGIGRELAFNDPGGGAAAAIGAPHDLNVELLVRASFDLSGIGPPVVPAPKPPPTQPLPSTGAGGLTALAGAAAVAGAATLRRRAGSALQSPEAPQPHEVSLALCQKPLEGELQHVRS